MGDLTAALKLIDLRLKEYKNQHKQATLVVLQSHKSASNLQISGLPSLLNDFPVLKLNPGAADNEFPALEWIKYACKRSVFTQSETVDAVQM